MNSFDIAKLLNIMPLNVYWKDKNGVYLGCNLAQALFFGFKEPQEVVGKTDLQLANNNPLAQDWAKNDQKVMRSGTPMIVEEVAILNEKKISGLSCKIPFKDDFGSIAGMMGITIDITEQKKIEEQLKQEKKSTQIALDNIIARLPGHVYWMNKENQYLGCNNLHVESAGLKNRQEIVGKTNYQMPWANQAEALNAVNNIVMTSGKEIVEEESGELADGTRRTFLSRKTPLLDDQDSIIGVLGISFDITDRKIMEQELLKSKNAAESANRAKTEFLANMSHDVKTPMTGVVSVADLMRTRSDWCTPENAETIYSCGLQVLNFFNSCLELSKLEMAEWDSMEHVFSLKILLDEMYALFLPRAQSKQLQFKINYDMLLPTTLIGHRGSVYRILLNLVGNALKFTEKGEVSVRIFLEKEISSHQIQIGLEVKDTGIGIPEDKQGVIFEKLRRLTPSYEGKIEGSGIGLYIVDQYIKRMGGTIQVDSVMGSGSTFTVLLPMTITQENSVDKVLKNESLISSPTLSSSASNISTSFSPAKIEKTLPHDAPHLLLVEDNLLVQRITQLLLQEAGFRVEIASTGAEALELFAAKNYDLIYMDIGLPDTDGYAVTHAIREKEALTKAKMTPIVALTGHGAIDVKTFCGKAGMQGVLSKPLTREQAEKVWRRYGKYENVDVPGLIVL